MTKALNTFTGKLTIIIAVSAFSLYLPLLNAPPAQAENHVPFEDSFDVPPEPSEYKKNAYRSPVPATLKGATVLSNQQAMDLWNTKSAVFIDVLPRAPKPKGLPKGTIWRDKRRDNIPGSIWLVNVGYGILSKPAEKYFKTSLENFTGGEKSKPVVFYCLANCWMSWNAAKRAVEWGYTNVSWFPNGTDGWTEIGGKLERKEPVPAE